MAGLREMALGITSALQFGPEPEPLPIVLRGQSPHEATFLLRSVIDECVDAEITLSRVEIGSDLFESFPGFDGNNREGSYRGVVVNINVEATGRIELFRR